jgi:RNA polymerase sigma-70 factor (ECF subfamily)
LGSIGVTEGTGVADIDESGDLLRRAADGDPDAFGELFGRHRAALHRAVARRLGAMLSARIDPSDVLQDVQIDVLGRLTEYFGRRPMPFRVWLLRSAIERVSKLRRHAVAARRDIGRERSLAVLESSSSSPARPFKATPPTPSQQAAARDVAGRLHAALEQLPESDRALLNMRAFEGLSYEEAGARSGIDSAAARKRYGRALLRLRAHLLAEGLTESHLWKST